MGCDIHGWIEQKKEDGEWVPLSNAGYLLNRNYDLFGLLFGVRNYCGFVPIADHRGIPDDATELVKKEHEGWGRDAHSESHIYLGELLAINLEMESELLDERIHQYNRKGDYVGKCSAAGKIDALYIRQHGKKNGFELEDGDTIYRLEKVKAKEALADTSYDKVLSLMKKASFDEDQRDVRLVVWFDN